MGIFESSHSWIIALGKTLAHSIWTGLLILSVLKVVFLLLPVKLASYRYRLAMSALLLYAGSAILLFSLFYSPPAGIPVTSGLTGTLKAYYFSHPEIGRQPYLSVWTCCSYIYFAGIILFLANTIVSLRAVHHLRRTGSPVLGVWLDKFNKLRDRAGIRCRVELLSSEQTDTPILVGLIRSSIIVPAGMLTQLPVGQIEAILMHELFHLKRYDHLALIIQKAIETLLFFSPVTWSISAMISREREKCCDDLVLRDCSRPLDYARALYQLALVRRNTPALVSAATGNNREQLRIRIQRILNPSAMKTNIREKISALALIIAGMIIVTIITGFSSGFSVIRYKSMPYEKGPAVVQEPRNKHVQEKIPDTSAIPDPADPDTPETEYAAVPAPQALPEPATYIYLSPLPAAQPLPEELPEPEALPESAVSPFPHPVMDTVPEPDDLESDEAEISREEIQKEIEEAMADIDLEKIQIEIEEAMENIDLEQIQKEVEKAMEEIDLEQIQKDVEKAMEEIDLEQIQKDVEKAMAGLDMEEIKKNMEAAKLEAAKLEALEEIDWDAIKKDVEAAKLEALEEIDWDAIRKDMEAAKLEALEDVDWDAIKKDVEAAKLEALENVDWDAIKREMDAAKVHLDSVLQEINTEFDYDLDTDVEVESEDQ